MKTVAIKTPTAELIIVELEKGARKTAAFIVDVNGDPILDNYTLLGNPDEIKEEDARKLVQYLTRRDLTITPKNYSKGKDGRFEDITFTESLLSLIETEIYWENPIKVHTWASENADMYLKQWQEAEQKTFDRKRTLIFKKNK